MAAPIAFPSTTQNLSLPLLFAGQAQKEFFLNQSFTVLDAIFSASITETRAAPPASPSEGACYRVSGSASGDWVGHDNNLAVRIGGAWQFISPQDGMRVFDRNAGAMLLYRSGWQNATEPSLPTGGATIDTEARDAITQLFGELRKVGILPIQP